MNSLFHIKCRSILLFEGAYVWIKFRDVASVYRRSRKDELGRVTYHGKYEPRFKPPREKKIGGTSQKFNYLPLGGYDTQQDAETVYQIAAFYYAKDEGRLELQDGSYFPVPPMSEQQRSLSGKEKAQWVSATARKVYQDFQKEKAARSQLREVPEINANAGEQVDIARDPSHSTEDGACGNSRSISADELAEFLLQDPHVVSSDSELFSDFDDILGAFQEALGGTPLSSEIGSAGTWTEDFFASEHNFLRTELNCRGLGSDFNTKQQSLIQQLTNLEKEQLEGEFNRRIAEQNEQHVQREQQLEEQISELQREVELLRSILHQVVQPLRYHFAEI